MADGGGTVRRGWRVRGRVQGVGFRWHTVRTARELGVEGRVWNRPDGTVEVHAGGEPGAVERLGAWLRQGPPSARVEEVLEIEAGPEASEPGFHAIL